MAETTTNLHNPKRKVIACATVIEEMLPFLPKEVPYEVLDFGLHLNPSQLKEMLQDKIDQASQEADVLLLGYGLCSMAVIGLKASTAALVIPRTDDCIGIFLGSAKEYERQTQKEPGTYYLTKGWIEGGDTPFDEYKKLIKKYGNDKAKRMTQLMLKNYQRLAFINTGDDSTERYHAYAKSFAQAFDLSYEELQGNSTLVRKMIDGPWDEDFVVVLPGQTLTYQAFVGESSDG